LPDIDVIFLPRAEKERKKREREREREIRIDAGIHPR